MMLLINNPESIKQKIADLGAAGGNLGKFYSSLASPALASSNERSARDTVS